MFLLSFADVWPVIVLSMRPCAGWPCRNTDAGIGRPGSDKCGGIRHTILSGDHEARAPTQEKTAGAGRYRVSGMSDGADHGNEGALEAHTADAGAGSGDIERLEEGTVNRVMP